MLYKCSNAFTGSLTGFFSTYLLVGDLNILIFWTINTRKLRTKQLYRDFFNLLQANQFHHKNFLAITFTLNAKVKDSKSYSHVVLLFSSTVLNFHSYPSSQINYIYFDSGWAS